MTTSLGQPYLLSHLGGHYIQVLLTSSFTFFCPEELDPRINSLVQDSSVSSDNVLEVVPSDLHKAIALTSLLDYQSVNLWPPLNTCTVIKPISLTSMPYHPALAAQPPYKASHGPLNTPLSGQNSPNSESLYGFLAIVCKCLELFT